MNKFLAMTALVGAGFAASACTTNERTLSGGAIGGVGGAVIGNSIAGTGGAVIGGVGGAVGGAAVGRGL